MTEHDGLTAEQEAGRVWSTKRDQIIFVRGAEWATEREKARAEAAEARVKYLEGLGSRAQLDMLEFERSERRRAEARVAELERALSALVDKILGPDEGAEAWDELIDLADAGMRALTASTTEAVTEVEGS